MTDYKYFDFYTNRSKKIMDLKRSATITNIAEEIRSNSAKVKISRHQIYEVCSRLAKIFAFALLLKTLYPHSHPHPNRAHPSVGLSSRGIIYWSQVQILLGQQKRTTKPNGHLANACGYTSLARMSSPIPSIQIRLLIISILH